jgi:hypothetical protein
MAQVTEFVRQAVPAGLDVSGSTNVDPVARLAAFNASVRPRLTTESDQYRFGCFNLLSSALAILPSSPIITPTQGLDPTKVSVFAAKVQSVSSLAVDDGSRDLIRQAAGLASCYQSLIVATKLSSGAQPERLHLISQNYSAASKAIESTGRWAPLVIRLNGLSQQCQAVDLYMTGKELGEARRLLGASAERLLHARSLLSQNPELGYMTTALDQELAIIRTVGSMVSISESSATVAPHPVVYAQRISGILDWLSRYAPGDWAHSFRSAKLREEVFRRAAEVRAAQAGRGSVKVLWTGSGMLAPFWVVELPYTFETGMLWAKRGKEVPEILLVAASFPTDLSSLSRSGCAKFLTDVFATARSGRPLNEYYDRVRGAEQKISESGGLAPILQSAVAGSIPGGQAIPPLTTEAEALKLVQLYVENVRSTNAKVAAQLRASSPRVLDLVYFSTVIQAFPPVPWLGPLSPVSLGDPSSLLGLVS